MLGACEVDRFSRVEALAAQAVRDAAAYDPAPRLPDVPLYEARACLEKAELAPVVSAPFPWVSDIPSQASRRERRGSDGPSALRPSFGRRRLLSIPCLDELVRGYGADGCCCCCCC